MGGFNKRLFLEAKWIPKRTRFDFNCLYSGLGSFHFTTGAIPGGKNEMYFFLNKLYLRLIMTNDELEFHFVPP